MKATIRSVAAVAVLGMLATPAVLHAQDALWTGGVGGNWTASTWNFGGPPDPSLDERGIIGTDVGSGSPIGEVNVTSDIRASFPSPTVVLGDQEGNRGTLNIASNGALAVVSGAAGSEGHFETGLDGGTGILNVAGILEVEGELRATTNANVASTISITGTGSVTAASGFLDRTLIIDGPNASVNFTGNLILGQAARHIWRIRNAGASTINVGGNADLGGTLVVEFPDGSPAVGTTWNLIDSATVDTFETVPSGFNNFDFSSVGLGLGQAFSVREVGGGANGRITQLSLDQLPVLFVDRQTGAAEIRNPGSSATIDFDNYAVSSALGSLVQGNWSSIAPADGWQEANPSSTALSELNPINTVSLSPAGSIPLGNIVDLPVPTSFGQPTEDIRFRIGGPGNAKSIEGVVVYTGLPNNTLTLNVDPATGEAQILNPTAFSATIDIYQISSSTGSLEPGDADWNSLDDQGATGGNWHEANISPNRLTELLPVGGMTFGPNTATPIGSPFDAAGGFQDLVFEFALVGNSLGNAGDFDADEDRDGADFLAWQRGESPDPRSVGDLADWEAGFGIAVSGGGNILQTGTVLYSPLVTLGGSVGSVIPEPVSLGLAVAAVALAGCLAPRRRRSIA